jgi:hypothetical protein
MERCPLYWFEKRSAVSTPEALCEHEELQKRVGVPPAGVLPPSGRVTTVNTLLSRVIEVDPPGSGLLAFQYRVNLYIRFTSIGPCAEFD